MAETNRKKMRRQWKMHKFLWKLSGGRLGRKVMGMPIQELVTTSHKSGQERRILISYVDSDGSPAIIGTHASRDVDPAWVKNLRAQPAARARWDGQWWDVTAVELDGDDHQQAWNTAVNRNEAYAEYSKTLTRPIPIMRLVRA